MSLTQSSWPKDIDPNKSAAPKWLVGLTNRNRFRSRFWLSPVGIAILLLISGVFFILNALR